MVQPTGGVVLLTDTKPSEPKTLLELKVKKAVPAPAPGSSGPSGDQGSQGIQATPISTPVNTNTVDEGDDEASLPGEFEYHSDGGEGDENLDGVDSCSSNKGYLHILCMGIIR